jgi:hypothetical protein
MHTSSTRNSADSQDDSNGFGGTIKDSKTVENTTSALGAEKMPGSGTSRATGLMQDGLSAQAAEVGGTARLDLKSLLACLEIPLQVDQARFEALLEASDWHEKLAHLINQCILPPQPSSSTLSSSLLSKEIKRQASNKVGPDTVVKDNTAKSYALSSPIDLPTAPNSIDESNSSSSSSTSTRRSVSLRTRGKQKSQQQPTASSELPSSSSSSSSSSSPPPSASFPPATPPHPLLASLSQDMLDLIADSIYADPSAHQYLEKLFQPDPGILPGHPLNVRMRV